MKYLLTEQSFYRHACRKTTKKKLIGIDNLNKYYDVNLKRERLKLKKYKNFSFVKAYLIHKKLKNYLKNLNLML